MTIKGLGQLIKGKGTVCNLETFRGSVIAIDTPIYLFKYKYSCESTEQLVSKFNSQIKKFLKNDITPIYIFDGKHPDLKKGTQETRKKTCTVNITPEDKEAVKNLFTENSIKWLIAPTEAEKYCSYLNKTGKADYVFSNDYDTFAFGCDNLVTFQNSEYTLYKVNDIISNFDVTTEQFLQACLASGSDFCPKGIPGIGLKKAFALLKKNESLINLASQEYIDSVDELSKIFTDFSIEETTEFS